MLSPSTVARDRTRKRHHYARAGVSHLCFIEPVPQTLEIFRLDGDGWRLANTAAGDTAVRAEPFDAIELDLASLWAR